MGFEKGNSLWKLKKNFKHSEATKIAISKKKKGISVKHEGQFKNRHTPWNKKPYKIKIRKTNKGKIPWNKNKCLSENYRIKLSMAKTHEKEFTGFREIINKRIRLSRKYLEWRSEVFKRDNYHCQNCDNKGYIEAHHIISFSKLLEIYNIKTLEQAMKCDALWDIGNGITYCINCHILLDENRGRKKCAQIQP